jgi:hypothetical protein
VLQPGIRARLVRIIGSGMEDLSKSLQMIKTAGSQLMQDRRCTLP